MNQRLRLEVAYHESGHATVCRLVGLRGGGATIRDGDAHACWKGDGSIADVIACLAGRAASEVILGRSSRWGCSYDNDRAGYLLTAERDLREARIAYWQCLGHAKCLIRHHRAVVERVALALLERETLSGAEIDQLMVGLR
jgi:ATP-dependent Zn protease